MTRPSRGVERIKEAQRELAAAINIFHRDYCKAVTGDSAWEADKKRLAYLVRLAGKGTR